MEIKAERKYTLYVALLTTASLYVDVILKIILSFFGKEFIYVDYCWFIVLVLVNILTWILHFKVNRFLSTISYAVNCCPVLVFLSYWITLALSGFQQEGWQVIMTYMAAEIVLFIPVYIMTAIDLKNQY